MSSLPPLTNLLAFEAVARRRSFSLAAVELHLTASAVSHQIARLESHVGVRLFERSAHGVRLSTAGDRYLSRISGALSAIAAASDDLRQGVSNSLYLHSSPSFAALWLGPRLRGFASAHPEIAFNLSASPSHSDFHLGESDIDVRYGIPAWPNLVVEPLFTERITPLASPQFIRSHRLKRPEQLLDVPLIQSNVGVVQWPDWFSSVTGRHVQVRCTMRFDRAAMALDVAAQGLGVAFESTTIGAGHIAAGRLKPVFGSDASLEVQVHFAVYPARHAKRAPVDAFLTWLREEAATPARRERG